MPFQKSKQKNLYKQSHLRMCERRSERGAVDVATHFPKWMDDGCGGLHAGSPSCHATVMSGDEALGTW